MRRASVRGGARTPMTEPSIWYMSRRRIYKDDRRKTRGEQSVFKHRGEAA